ncbi:hypothetical protein [Streptomyces yaizuensis]|uniref:Zinc-ribbon domain-containing protein n=1 Tax=Streptomyces yaizuensis TaxID=2989713 RepID=A0ABQ5NY37_9ACTN|nr:hypothetical protein [Streptomyces sp. YSPA8]GLF95277.1 zinc-ribbon domain-containing protein [Streptomyces sp. YSPA8]
MLAGTEGAPTGRAQAIRTEFDFTLPVGYHARDGGVHTSGTMRLATARDELAPLIDQRVRENPAYLGIVLLSLVITRLGTLSEVRPDHIEGLFAEDLAYLQDFYHEVNGVRSQPRQVACPGCGMPFEVAVGGERLGES